MAQPPNSLTNQVTNLRKIADEVRKHFCVPYAQDIDDAADDIERFKKQVDLLHIGHEQRCKENADLRDSLERINAHLEARPASEYHKDFGSVLWWHFPISEPPHVGTPTDTAWPDDGAEYYTHWSPIPTPTKSAVVHERMRDHESYKRKSTTGDT